MGKKVVAQEITTEHLVVTLKRIRTLIDALIDALAGAGVSLEGAQLKPQDKNCPPPIQNKACLPPVWAKWCAPPIQNKACLPSVRAKSRR